MTQSNIQGGENGGEPEWVRVGVELGVGSLADEAAELKAMIEAFAAALAEQSSAYPATASTLARAADNLQGVVQLLGYAVQQAGAESADAPQPTTLVLYPADTPRPAN